MTPRKSTFRMRGSAISIAFARTVACHDVYIQIYHDGYIPIYAITHLDPSAVDSGKISEHINSEWGGQVRDQEAGLTAVVMTNK